MPIGPVIISLKAKILSDEERGLLKHKKIGGIVLFKENYDEESEDPKQALKALIAEIRKINKDIIIMVDHEGGRVWRFKKGFTHLKSAKDFGKFYDEDKDQVLKEIREAASIMASELVECGVDMSLAPVLDLHGINKAIGGFDRAFHTDKTAVTEMGEAFILGMRDGGMLGVAKHFPGHGSVAPDTHHEVARDTRDTADLSQDLYPFKRLIEKKLIAAVMPAHVIYNCVDANNPAGFSEIWIKGCLRMGCGFQGVVISDALSMAAANIGDHEKRLKAAEKVCDFLMFPRQHKEEELTALVKALDKLEENKESGERRQALRNNIDAQLERVKTEKRTLVREVISSSSSLSDKSSTPWFQRFRRATAKPPEKPSSARGSDTQESLSLKPDDEDKSQKTKTRRSKSLKGNGERS